MAQFYIHRSVVRRALRQLLCLVYCSLLVLGTALVGAPPHEAARLAWATGGSGSTARLGAHSRPARRTRGAVLCAWRHRLVTGSGGCHGSAGRRRLGRVDAADGCSPVYCGSPFERHRPDGRAILLPPVLSHHALCCQHRHTPTSTGRHLTDNVGIKPRATYCRIATLAPGAGHTLVKPTRHCQVNRCSGVYEILIDKRAKGWGKFV